MLYDNNNQQTVNLLAYAFDGSNPSPTTTLSQWRSRDSSVFRAKTPLLGGIREIAGSPSQSVTRASLKNSAKLCQEALPARLTEYRLVAGDEISQYE
jgi:hypothetical protein